MGKHSETPAAGARGPLERARAPTAPRRRGEYPGKRDEEQRNDPEVEPGAIEGNAPRRERMRRREALLRGESGPGADGDGD